jgi:acetyl esterase/lipase
MSILRRLLLTLSLPLLAYPLWAQGPAPAPDLPAVAALAARLQALTMPRQPDRAWRLDYPFALLQLEKARVAQQEHWRDPAPLAQAGQDALDKLKAGQPIEPTPGQVTELAYLAANDGSAQPYHLYLPKDYSSRKVYPLIIFLHGYVPTTSLLDPWILTDSECALAGNLGAIVLMPYGRRNSDFQGIGEMDVLAALRQTQDLFSVDDQRLYLTGVSMGARGVWHIAAHHPGLFAAIAPIAGHTDMPLWWGWDKTKMPGWKRWLNARDNPIDLAENLRNLPIFVQHGGEDTLIPAQQSRLMVARLKELDLPVEYKEYPGASHYIYWDPETYRLAFEFLVKHRLNPSPVRVTFKAYSLDWAQSYWISTDSFAAWGRPGYADAQAAADRSSITIDSSNLATLALNLQQAPVQQQGPIRIIMGGEQRSAQAAVGGWSWNLLAAPPAASCWCAKRPGLCGPLDQAFNGPFLVVPGTAGSAAQDRALRAEAEAWIDQWNAFCDGRPPLVADADVSQRDLEEHNLILFGTPRTNSLLARMAGSLPIKIGDHRYQVGKRVYQGPTLGLAMVYPNPLAPRRLVVVFAGETWGRHLAVNHKFDELPDYLVYDTSAQEYDDTDQHLCAGLFDLTWQLDESLQSRTSEGTPARGGAEEG